MPNNVKYTKVTLDVGDDNQCSFFVPLCMSKNKQFLHHIADTLSVSSYDDDIKQINLDTQTTRFPEGNYMNTMKLVQERDNYIRKCADNAAKFCRVSYSGNEEDLQDEDQQQDLPDL